MLLSELADIAFNRTSLELKLVPSQITSAVALSAFNRTSLELKHDEIGVAFRAIHF